MIWLSNDIRKLKMGKKVLLKIGLEFEKLFFSLHFSAGDISPNNLF